jgi:hypothetical protein
MVCLTATQRPLSQHYAPSIVLAKLRHQLVTQSLRHHCWVATLNFQRKTRNSTARTADSGRLFSIAQWSAASRRACAVTLFCLSNNSDVEVIGSLLLVHCVLLPRAVCLCLSVDEISSKDSGQNLSPRLYRIASIQGLSLRKPAYSRPDAQLSQTYFRNEQNAVRFLQLAVAVTSQLHGPKEEGFSSSNYRERSCKWESKAGGL